MKYNYGNYGTGMISASFHASLTQGVNPFIKNQFAMSEVIKERFKVRRTSINEECTG